MVTVWTRRTKLRLSLSLTLTLGHGSSAEMFTTRLQPNPDPCGARAQRCLLYTCDPSVQHKEMESSLAAVKTFAKLRVSSGLRHAPQSLSDGSPAGLATPAVLYGVQEEAPAEAKPPAGASLRTVTVASPPHDRIPQSSKGPRLTVQGIKSATTLASRWQNSG